jgi:hypothetical protein
MTLWTILVITFTAPAGHPLHNVQTALPFPSEQACGDAMLDLSRILPPADYACDATAAFATSIRPKGRP